LTAGQFFHSYILKPHARLKQPNPPGVIEIIGLYFVDLPGFPHLLKLLRKVTLAFASHCKRTLETIPASIIRRSRIARAKVSLYPETRSWKANARNATTKDDGSEEESRSEL
jgi:hypothetical protein